MPAWMAGLGYSAFGPSIANLSPWMMHLKSFRISRGINFPSRVADSNCHSPWSWSRSAASAANPGTKDHDVHAAESLWRRVRWRCTRRRNQNQSTSRSAKVNKPRGSTTSAATPTSNATLHRERNDRAISVPRRGAAHRFPYGSASTSAQMILRGLKGFKYVQAVWSAWSGSKGLSLQATSRGSRARRLACMASHSCRSGSCP